MSCFRKQRSVGRQIFLKYIFTWEKHKNHSKYTKIRKNLRCLNFFRVGPKKVGSVEFPETRYFFFGLTAYGYKHFQQLD